MIVVDSTCGHYIGYNFIALVCTGSAAVWCASAYAIARIAWLERNNFKVIE